MGPDRNTHLRNAGIVLLLAVALWQLPGGDTAADVIGNVLGIAFAAGLVFFALPDVHGEPAVAVHARGQGAGLLYGSFVLIALALVGTRSCGTRAASACSSGSR